MSFVVAVQFFKFAAGNEFVADIKVDRIIHTLVQGKHVILTKAQQLPGTDGRARPTVTLTSTGTLENGLENASASGL